MIDPDALRATLDDLNAKGKQIDHALGACPGLTPAKLAEWTDYYTRFLTFAAATNASIAATLTMVVFPASYANSLTQIQADESAYEITMNRWADYANATCGTSIGDAPPKPPATGLDYLTAGTYLAVALGGLYLLATFGPSIAGLLPARRRRR